jgi:hypothetical protein
MSGSPGGRTIEAMKLVLAGISPYAAAKRIGIATNTMYRSRLYKLWKEAQPLEFTDKERHRKLLTELRRELDMTRPIPRVRDKKKQRFTPKAKQE